MKGKSSKALLALLAPSKDDDMGEEEGGEEESYDAEFEEAAVKAFPDLEGDAERIEALKAAIKLCM